MCWLWQVRPPTKPCARARGCGRPSAWDWRLLPFLYKNGICTYSSAAYFLRNNMDVSSVRHSYRTSYRDMSCLTELALGGTNRQPHDHPHFVMCSVSVTLESPPPRLLCSASRPQTRLSQCVTEAGLARRIVGVAFLTPHNTAETRHVGEVQLCFLYHSGGASKKHCPA